MTAAAATETNRAAEVATLLEELARSLKRVAEITEQLHWPWWQGAMRLGNEKAEHEQYHEILLAIGAHEPILEGALWEVWNAAGWAGSSARVDTLSAACDDFLEVLAIALRRAGAESTP